MKIFGKRDWNIGVKHGEWGERFACKYLRKIGYEIVDRNVRPCKWDLRYEIDIIAYFKDTNTIVFVEVKQHSSRSPYQNRLRSVNARKMKLLHTACRTWLRNKKWNGNYRFDVVEIYGTPEDKTTPEIDHVERVRLLERPDRFVDWAM